MTGMIEQSITTAANATVVVAPDYRAEAAFLRRVPQMFAAGEGEVLHGGRNEVRLLTHRGARFVAKRYKRANPVQRVAYTFFRSTKAHRAYDYAAELRRRGISTPHEVAYIECREHGLFTTGYFVSLECPDPPAFDRLVRQERFDDGMAADMARFVVTMHSRGVLHGDMNFGNFLYRRGEGGKGYEFTVIDTNRSHFRDGWPSRGECLRNFCTMTHRRDVFAFIVRRYAALRGWDEDAALAEAEACLDRFESKHRRKDKMKRLFKGK